MVCELFTVPVAIKDGISSILLRRAFQAHAQDRIPFFRPCHIQSHITYSFFVHGRGDISRFLGHKFFYGLFGLSINSVLEEYFASEYKKPINSSVLIIKPSQAYISFRRDFRNTKSTFIFSFPSLLEVS